MVKNNKRYYLQSRLDVLQLVPESCERVLDVGCGYGALGNAIRDKKSAKHLVGIEKITDAEEYLKNIYDKYYISNVEDFRFSDPTEKFDCIIFADVLEHLVNPWETLKYFVKLLSNDGKIIISIPNVRNAVVLFRLLFSGTWRYEENGIMDSGHLRFFTFKEIERMIENANLKIEIVNKNYDKYNIVKSILLFFPSLVIQDLRVCQYIVRATRIK